MQGKAHATALVLVGLVVALLGSAVVYWFALTRMVPTNFSGVLAPTQSATEQQALITNYIKEALAIHNQYRDKKINREQARVAALQLKVPLVLRDRHLQWILALDQGTDAPIENMMNEYSLLQLAQ